MIFRRIWVAFLVGLALLLPAGVMADSDAESFDIDAATEFVEVNGEAFPVVDVGTGPAVLLLHGWPDSRKVWRNQIPALRDAGYRVIAPDLRGFGDAPLTSDVNAYSFFAQIGEINVILDTLGVGQVSVVGHDFGAVLAWTMARFIPQRFNALVVLSNGSPSPTNPGFRAIAQREKLWYNYFFLQAGLAEAEIAFNDYQFIRDFTDHPDVEVIIDELSRPGALTASLNWYRGNLTSVLTPEPGTVPAPPQPLPNVTQPVLGLHGSQDRFLLEQQMTASAAEIDNEFIFKRFRRAGHWLMLERPRRVNRLIVNFLECQVRSSCY